MEQPDPVAREREELIAIQEEKQKLLEEINALRADIKRVQQEIDEIDAQESDEEGEDKTAAALRRGRKTFNQSSKKGMVELFESGCLEQTPEAVADFLFKTEGLNKTQIGEYLGENDQFHLDVLAAFAKLHDFEGKDFDKALRQYLWSFRLPGESQKIDRMMERFAERYCECNPKDFSHPDTCYVLAFSVIMLNTSLHNPACKTRPTLESFISMNRGIDQGKDIDPQFLTQIYQSISSTPFKIPDDEDSPTYTFFNPEREGWLIKEGGGHKSWRRRWFVLSNNCIYYFEKPEDSKPKGTIPLENLICKEVGQYQRKDHVFEILCESGESAAVKGAKVNRKGQVVQGKHTSYKIQAPSKVEMEEWIRSIRAAMTKDPFYELYRSKRQHVSSY